MIRFSIALTGVCLLAISSGCSMCCAPFDSAFGAYGGVVERGDIYQGRVASVFDPPGAQAVYETADTTAVEPNTIVEPETAFEPIDEAEIMPDAVE